MANIFQRIFDAIKNLVTRPGFKTFISKYEKLALETISELADVNSNAGFHQWKDQAFAKVKAETKALNDNWITILIHLGYESFKAQQSQQEKKTAPLSDS